MTRPAPMISRTILAGVLVLCCGLGGCFETALKSDRNPFAGQETTDVPAGRFEGLKPGPEARDVATGSPFSVPEAVSFDLVPVGAGTPFFEWQRGDGARTVTLVPVSHLVPALVGQGFVLIAHGTSVAQDFKPEFDFDLLLQDAGGHYVLLDGLDLELAATAATSLCPAFVEDMTPFGETDDEAAKGLTWTDHVARFALGQAVRGAFARRNRIVPAEPMVQGEGQDDEAFADACSQAGEALIANRYGAIDVPDLNDGTYRHVRNVGLALQDSVQIAMIERAMLDGFWVWLAEAAAKGSSWSLRRPTYRHEPAGSQSAVGAPAPVALAFPAQRCAPSIRLERRFGPKASEETDDTLPRRALASMRWTLGTVTALCPETQRVTVDIRAGAREASLRLDRLPGGGWSSTFEDRQDL